MRILVLSARPDTASNRRLAAAAVEAGVEIDLIDATELASDSTGGVLLCDRNLLTHRPEVVLARVGNWRPESLLALLETVTAQGVPTPNPAEAIRIGRDHWRTVHILAAAGLPVPLTLAGADPEALARAVQHRLRFPVVVKQRRSRMGVGVILCRSADHLEAVLDSLWRVGDEVVVQQYHDTRGSSLRLLVAGSEMVAAARFTAADGEWRSNAARGGGVENVELGHEVVELALAAARAADLGICGVDLLPTRDGMLIGELNPTPGFSALERATGVDVARVIVDRLLEIGA
jgi:RimK family alpha-L-glutamate ligase